MDGLYRRIGFRWLVSQRNPLALRRAVAPDLRAVSRACVPKYAAPAISRESPAPQPFSLTYYANLDDFALPLAWLRFSLTCYANQEHLASLPSCSLARQTGRFAPSLSLTCFPLAYYVNLDDFAPSQSKTDLWVSFRISGQDPRISCNASTELNLQRPTPAPRVRPRSVDANRRIPHPSRM